MTLPVEPESESRSCWHHAAVSRETCAQLTLGIVHEMNNLTGGIAVLSELYLQEAAGLSASEGFELIHRSTARLQALTRHLKTIHGPLRETPTYVELGELVRGSLDLFAPVLPKSVVMTMDFPLDEGLVAYLDEALFRQALLDVLLNLRDALLARPGHGSLNLHVSLQRAAKMTELVLAAMHDDGTDPGGVTEDSPRWSEGRTRWCHAASALEELGGRLTRGAHGEFIFELPPVG